MVENLYGIHTGPAVDPTFHYVGKTIRSIDQRWAEHVRDAKNGHTKELYEHMRHVGVDKFCIVLLDTTEGGLTETDFVQTLIKDGHPLLNANLGNKTVAKKRNNTFSLMNKEAENALLVKENAEKSGRKVRLHSNKQNLTKSEIVRQRLHGQSPTVDGVMACAWYPVPPELLGVKVAKTADRAESAKWGDYVFFIAYRKKDKQVSCVVRHPTKGNKWANGATYTNCSKDRIIELLILGWDREYPGWLKNYD